ncbi:hypothetical protein [Larkinella terrae]|uniref:Uncharacterized protein n=1 Tax=Larkinella terrae TaxID=2025311 RepID=A0A7K0EIS4_9BACT|nr:hypothetical protein [Larkinella terrae]MRS61655.1 hypothetical protein [Larkinella terrae]
MKTLLEWAIGELTSRHRLRNNQILGEINHAGRNSVELLFLDKDQPERGAVELLLVQSNSVQLLVNGSCSAFSCQISTLMELAGRSDQSKKHHTTLQFTTTQEVIDWLETTHIANQ